MSSKSILSEYGCTADQPAAPNSTAGQYPTVKALPKLPAAVAPTSLQNAFNQKAQVFEWVRKMKFGKQASDRNNKLAVFKLAIKNASPLRGRAGSARASLPGKYQPAISYDLMRVWDYVVSVYTPDKNGNRKHAAFFDGGGQFKFNTEKVAKQLRIPLRTLQRYLAKLDAMKLLDRHQISKLDDDGEYRGSTTWVLLRADVYMDYLSQVIIQRSIGNVAGNGKAKPVVAADVTASEPELQSQNQASETTVLETNPDDNIVTPFTVLMEPPSSGFEKQATHSPSGSPSVHICSGAVAPAARPPQKTSFVSGKEKPAATPAEVQPASATSSHHSSPGDPTYPHPGKLATPGALAQDEVTPVAPIEVPASVFELGDKFFQQLTRRLARAFPETELTMAHCHQLRSWMSRSSPFERMTYDDLDDILKEHETGFDRQSLNGKPYQLTLDWLIKAWPQVLREHRHEQLELRNAGTAAHFLELMTTRAEPEFDAHILHAVRCIEQSIRNNGSDVHCNPAAMFASQYRLYGFIACFLLGMDKKIHEAISDPIWLKSLKKGISEMPLDALLARAKYPELMSLCGFEQIDWEHMKESVIKQYKHLIELKGEAEIWKLPLRNYATVSDGPGS